MILIYLLAGVLTVMLLALALIPKQYLLDGGWTESEIMSVKKFFHTENLWRNATISSKLSNHLLLAKPSLKSHNKVKCCKSNIAIIKRQSRSEILETSNHINR